MGEGQSLYEKKGRTDFQKRVGSSSDLSETHPICASIDFLHRGPYRLMAHITAQLPSPAIPRIVKSHPLPMASIAGAVRTPAAQENKFRTKLFTATPAEDFWGMNSVSMVVAMLKMSMEPTPKMKHAII